jgi:hypothetical protein
MTTEQILKKFDNSFVSFSAGDKKWGLNFTDYHNQESIQIELIKDFLTFALYSQREAIREKVENFDITSGIHGQAVKNPLMRLEDVKNLILQAIKEI